MRARRTVPALFLVLVCLVGVSPTGAVTPEAAPGAATVFLTIARSSVPVGALVPVYVRIRDAHDVGSVPFTLLYDPQALEYIGSATREGAFLGSDGTPTLFLATDGETPGGARGITVGLSRLGAHDGAEGRGILCRLLFRAVGAGSTRLSFARATVLDSRASDGRQAVFEDAVITVRGAP